MDKKLEMPPFLTDIRMMEWSFVFPLLISIMATGYIYMLYGGYGSVLKISIIKNALNIFCIPFISIWVITLYKDIVDPSGKDLLLSLPYGDLQFGLFRVFRVTFLYLCFFILVLLFLVKHCRDSFLLSELYLPLASIIFFSALSFLVIVLTKNVLISYAVIAIFSSLQYMTRGGILRMVYPFQWCNPKPIKNPWTIPTILLMCSIGLFFAAQWVFHKREKSFENFHTVLKS